MGIRPKLLMGAGIAFAGLGLIGAGAGATFTAQVAGTATVSTGGVGLSLNGQTGSGLHLGVDGTNLGSHFTPISRDLLLKNTGTLDLASDYLTVAATGCDGGAGGALVGGLRVTLVDVTNDKPVYDGPLCDWPTRTGPDHTADREQPVTAGLRLPSTPRVGQSLLYRMTLEPKDPVKGLPGEAQNSHTSVSVTFTGSDY